MILQIFSGRFLEEKVPDYYSDCFSVDAFLASKLNFEVHPLFLSWKRFAGEGKIGKH